MNPVPTVVECHAQADIDTMSLLSTTTIPNPLGSSENLLSRQESTIVPTNLKLEHEALSICKESSPLQTREPLLALQDNSKDGTLKRCGEQLNKPLRIVRRKKRVTPQLVLDLKNSVHDRWLLAQLEADQTFMRLHNLSYK